VHISPDAVAVEAQRLLPARRHGSELTDMIITEEKAVALSLKELKCHLMAYSQC
jgi:hypothetical protein